MIRWGILGAGSVAQRRVMPAMQAHPGSAVQAIMVRDQARADAIAAQFGAAKAYHSVEALVGDADVDAVYVSSPANVHCEHVLAAAKAGKHVLCEKPMGLTAEECRRMIDACDEAVVHLQVCLVLRGWPIYHRIREMIGEGTFGQIVEVRAHLTKWTPFAPDAWRLDAKQSGGGVLIDVGAHYLDLFRFLVGEFSKIACMSSSAVFNWAVEDSAFVTVAFQNGAHGVMGLSFAAPYNGQMLEIYGTKGSLFLGKELRVVTEKGEEVSPVVFPDYYSGLLANFCDGINGKAEPLAPGADGLRNIEAIAAAYRSGAEGRMIVF